MGETNKDKVNVESSNGTEEISFEFDKMGFWEGLSNKVRHGSENYPYEQIALELMAKHNEFYGELNKVEDEYALRGAVLSCTHGNRYIRLDMCQDHGVYSKEIPVMTCNDYKIDENIFSFGLCGNSEYEPVYSETAPPPAETGVDKDGNVRHICCPILLEKWGFGIGGKRFNNEGGLYIHESDMPSDCLTEMHHGDEQGGEYVEALSTRDNLICLYGGVITIEENPETEEETGLEEEVEPEETVIEENGNMVMMLVTLEELDQFGFYMGKSEEERKAGLETLNTVLNEYGITTDKQIAYFMGQVAKESGRGIRTLEQYDLNSGETTPEEHFNTEYKNKNGNTKEGDGELYRGAGYIHLTGRCNYEAFAKAMGEKYGKEEETLIISQGYRVVGGTYNKNVNDIAKNEKGVIDVGKYAWEASAWFWVEGNPDGVNLNKYVDEDDGRSIAEAINFYDKDSFQERDMYTNEFYKIKTGQSLGL